VKERGFINAVKYHDLKSTPTRPVKSVDPQQLIELPGIMKFGWSLMSEFGGFHACIANILLGGFNYMFMGSGFFEMVG